MATVVLLFVLVLRNGYFTGAPGTIKYKVIDMLMQQSRGLLDGDGKHILATLI
jgi:hypothetical protein